MLDSVHRASPRGADAGTASTAERLVRPDSHRLGQTGTGKAVLVEFLDFECESCRAAYPVVEDLGQFEAMYQRMYDTQDQWGEQQDSKAAVFHGFAQDLGLDMAAYDEAVADPVTAARVEKDRQDGLALGVQGTPTFFLDGRELQPTSVQDFVAQLDAAVNG